MLNTFINGQKKNIFPLYTFINGQKKYIRPIYTFINGQKKYLLEPLPDSVLLFSQTTSGAFTFSQSNLTYKKVTIDYAGASGCFGTQSLTGRGARSLLTITSPNSISITNGFVGARLQRAVATAAAGYTYGGIGGVIQGVSPTLYAWGGGGSTGFKISINGGTATLYQASGGGGSASVRGGTRWGNGGKGGGPGGGAGGTSASQAGKDATDGNNGYNQYEYDGFGWITITGWNIN